jgi:hypothetical protein
MFELVRPDEVVPIPERDILTPPLRITGGSDALERTGGG